jgi:predicted dienelactone hydrolase
MRTWEWVMCGAWLAAVIFAAVRKPTGATSVAMRLLPVAAAAVHVLVEGARWQLVPVYLAVMLCITRLLRSRVSFSTLALGVPGLALGLLFPVPSLPPPPGPYAVGTFSFAATDPARDEAFTPEADGNRRVMVQVWYPADAPPNAPRQPWLPRADVVGPAIAQWVKLPAFMFSHAGLIAGNSVENAPWNTSEQRWPLLIYSHGWGGFRQINATQSEALASRGYVVAAIDHPYGALVAAFDDGTALANRRSLLPKRDTPEFLPAAQRLEDVYARDITFVLDELTRRNDSDERFAGRLDLSRVGFFGHSTGGGAVVIACSRDPRCKALVGQDTWIEPVPDAIVEAGLDRPALYLRSEEWTGDDNDARLGRFFDASSGQRWRASIAGAGHYDFTLIPLFSPLAPYLGLKGPIAADRVMPLIDESMAAFFDFALRDAPPSRISEVAERYPEWK